MTGSMGAAWREVAGGVREGVVKGGSTYEQPCGKFWLKEMGEMLMIRGEWGNSFW